MVLKCSNCFTVVQSKDLYPNIVQILEEYYGESWADELTDISMEICQSCGTLDGFLPFIEENLIKKTAKSYSFVIKEFLENQHIPYLLSLGAPIFIYLLENGTISIKKASIDALGNFGALDDIGRFVIPNFDVNVRILGLRGLEKIEKHSKKRGLPFIWAEFIDIIIDNDLKTLKKLMRDLPKLGLKPETKAVIKKISEKRKTKLEKRK